MRTNKNSRTAKLDLVDHAAEVDPGAALAATLARNSKPAARFAVPVPAETDHAERQVAPVSLPKVPDTAPKAQTPKPPKVEMPCTCGCLGLTKGGRFLPGHDARLHGRVKKELEGRLDRNGLLDTELAAIELFLADGHTPPTTTSFAVQEHKIGQQPAKVEDRKRERLHARIAKLQSELDAVKAELDAMGEDPDATVSKNDHAEIEAAMAAELAQVA